MGWVGFRIQAQTECIAAEMDCARKGSGESISFSASRAARERMDLYKLAWLVWIGGTVLIVLSWNDTVSTEVGWVGFVIALIGVGLSFIPYIRAKPPKLPSNPTPGNDAGESKA
jgi:hypothetical protein